MTQVIADKITPPAEAPRLSRDRLLAQLRASLENCNSTIIQGRAGTGKTLLAADFARECGRRVAWYKLDAPDSELSSFFRYLCAAVGAVRPGFGKRVLAALGEQAGATQAGAADVSPLVATLIYELLESDEPLLVVIDDWHLIYDAGWVVPFFGKLLPLLPPEVHFVLIGRSLPPTPLWRMRSKQTLCVLDEEALAFTLAEARRLFGTYGLSPERAEESLLRTRGRASLLDAEARALSAGDARAAERQGGGREAQSRRTLRLVKGFRKSNLGTA
ncbi:MAG TPA: AAA family ATPase [Pyrinomonadaceae bacterium]|nr:AAA family ATPase [Pyrinomonadaceae bacterium]